MNALLGMAVMKSDDTTDANINGDFNTNNNGILISGEDITLQVGNDYLIGNEVFVRFFFP